MSAPVLTIIAGSNGSGKSTLTDKAKTKFQDTPILDPDAIARSLQDSLGGGHSDLEAGKRVLHEAEHLIASGQTFTVETTLSGSTYLRMALRARTAGQNGGLFHPVGVRWNRIRRDQSLPGQGTRRKRRPRRP